MGRRSVRERLCAAAALAAAAAMVVAGTVAGGGDAGAAANNLVTLRPGDFDFTGTEHGGHNVFQASGIQISTDNADNAEATGEFAVNKPLADVGEPSLQWTQTDPDGTIPPAALLSIDFDNDGTFDAYLIGETVYNGDWWAPSSTPDFVKEGAPSCHGNWQPGDDPSTKCDGGGGSYFHGTLAAWSAAFPNAQVQLAGYNLGSGVQNAGLLSSETVGNTTYNFTKILDQTQTIQESDFIPGLADTRSSGHFVFNKNSLHVYTDDNSSQAKVAEYWQPTNPIPLVHAGQPALDWDGTDAQPGIQLVVDFDNDGTPDGILVGEKVYGDDWWASGSTAQFVKDKAPSCTDIDTGEPYGSCTGGSGSPYHGLLAEWATAFPDAKIMDVGFSLGSGVLGDGTLNSIDVSNTEYTFANTPPTANDQTVSTDFDQPVDITLDASDPNSADTLQYTVGTPSHGQISGTAPSITYTPDAGFAGQDSFTWTVSDGVNDPVTGTVTVNVGKASSSVSVAFQPHPATSGDKVHAVVTVDTDGSADGGTVSVDVGKRGGKIYTGTVSGGQADVQLGKYDSGLHKALITFEGTDNAASTHTTTTFTVRKVTTGLAVSTNPANIKTTTKHGKLVVTVSTPGTSPNGASVTVKHLGSAVVKHGVATIGLPKLSAGKHSYTAKYSGNARTSSASQDFVIHVTKG